MNYKITSNGIREIRLSYHLSQAEFSALLGIGVITLSRLERGEPLSRVNENLMYAASNPAFMRECLMRNRSALKEEIAVALEHRLDEIAEKSLGGAVNAGSAKKAACGNIAFASMAQKPTFELCCLAAQTEKRAIELYARIGVEMCLAQVQKNRDAGELLSLLDEEWLALWHSLVCARDLLPREMWEMQGRLDSLSRLVEHCAMEFGTDGRGVVLEEDVSALCVEGLRRIPVADVAQRAMATPRAILVLYADDGSGICSARRLKGIAPESRIVISENDITTYSATVVRYCNDEHKEVSCAVREAIKLLCAHYGSRGSDVVIGLSNNSTAEAIKLSKEFAHKGFSVGLVGFGLSANATAKVMYFTGDIAPNGFPDKTRYEQQCAAFLSDFAKVEAEGRFDEVRIYVVGDDEEGDIDETFPRVKKNNSAALALQKALGVENAAIRDYRRVKHPASVRNALGERQKDGSAPAEISD